MERGEQEAQLVSHGVGRPVTSRGMAPSVEGSRVAGDRLSQRLHIQMLERMLVIRHSCSDGPM